MNAIPNLKIPFNEQRRKELKDDAKEFLKAFSLQFLKSYGWAFFEKIKQNTEDKPKDVRKLTYRKFNSVERRDLFSGRFNLCTGDGPGTFGNFKSVYLAERQDFNIDVYKCEKDFQKKKKPSKTIQLSGYQLVDNVFLHYKSLLNKEYDGLGLTEEEALLLLKFSNFSFAFVHPQRTNYIIQVHDVPAKCCACVRGAEAFDPNDGSEFADERDLAVTSFGRCLRSVEGRGDSILAKAFNDTIAKLKARLVNLKNWSDEGSEAQLLTEMGLAQCLPGLRDDILRDLKGPASVRLGLWFKTQGVISTVLSELIAPAWSAMQDAANTIDEKVEPTVKKGIGPILTVINKLKESLEEAVSDIISGILGEIVTPHLKPVFDALDSPMRQGFADGEKILDDEICVSVLPDDVMQREAGLNEIPRTQANVMTMGKAANKLARSLKDTKQSFPQVFQALDIDSVKAKSEKTLLETLDAAVYTLNIMLTEEGKDDKLKRTMLDWYKYDSRLACVAFNTSVMRAVFIPAFKKACSPHVDPVFKSADSHIPEELREIISTQAVWDDLVDSIIGDVINKTVQEAYEADV